MFHENSIKIDFILNILEINTDFLRKCIVLSEQTRDQYPTNTANEVSADLQIQRVHRNERVV